MARWLYYRGDCKAQFNCTEQCLFNTECHFLSPECGAMCRSVGWHVCGVDTTCVAAAATVCSDTATVHPPTHHLTVSCAVWLHSSAVARTGRVSVCQCNDVALGSHGGHGCGHRCYCLCCCNLWSLPSPKTDSNVQLTTPYC